MTELPRASFSPSFECVYNDEGELDAIKILTEWPRILEIADDLNEREVYFNFMTHNYSQDRRVLDVECSNGRARYRWLGHDDFRQVSVWEAISG